MMIQARYSLMVLLAGLLIGCGGGSDHEETASVTGTVTLKGTPVTKGRIAFYPPKGRPAMGAIQSDGTYTLTTFDQGDGALLGNHRVTITANETVGGPPTPSSFEEEIRQAAKLSSQAPAKTVWLVPQEYSNRKTSKLEAEVVSGDNTHDFNLD